MGLEPEPNNIDLESLSLSSKALPITKELSSHRSSNSEKAESPAPIGRPGLKSYMSFRSQLKLEETAAQDMFGEEKPSLDYRLQHSSSSSERARISSETNSTAYEAMDKFPSSVGLEGRPPEPVHANAEVNAEVDSSLSSRSADDMNLPSNEISPKEKRIAKLKGMVKMLALHKRVQNMRRKSSLNPAKMIRSLSAFRDESRRKERERKEKQTEDEINAKKHETLVDQLKLRKNTVAAYGLTAGHDTRKQLHQARDVNLFEETRICSFLMVWHPSSRPCRNWDMFIAFLVFTQLLMVPFQIAGFPGWDSYAVEQGNLWIDVVFLVDIFVQFNMAVEKGEQGYYGDEIELIVERKEIAKIYLKHWFSVDLVAVSPLFITIAEALNMVTMNDNSAETTNMLKLVKAARLPRLFRLIRIMRVLRTINMKSKRMQWFMYSRYSYLFSVFSLVFSLFIMVRSHASHTFFVFFFPLLG